jgi:glyoxylase-like metal-dependent hydrolase (beta-lactamase superfamily II)
VSEHTWTVGNVTIVKIVEMSAASPNGGPASGLPDAWPGAVLAIPWLIPDFATEEGHLGMSVHALLVDIGGQRIVVDTCIGNDKVRTMPQFDHLGTDFLNKMTEVGWPRESVDAVICTHLHLDHVGWNTMCVDGQWVPTFPNAQYYLTRVELEHVKARAQSSDQQSGYAAAMLDATNVYGDSIRPIIEAGVANLVETNAELFPGVRLLPTPGHTPGHVSVLIESEGAAAVITGDMMHHPCQIAHPEWCSAFDDNPTRSMETRREFLERFVDTGTLIIGTHFAGPSAGRLVRHEAGFRLATT